MRFEPEEKLEIIQLARYSGLGFDKTLSLFGIKPYRVWRWIRNIEQKGFAGLFDNPPIPKSLPKKHLESEKNLILEKANIYTHLNHRKLVHCDINFRGFPPPCGEGVGRGKCDEFHPHLSSPIKRGGISISYVTPH